MGVRFNSFGEWLKYWRTERGMTQDDVGNAVGRTKAMVSAWEREVRLGKSGTVSIPSVELVQTLARLFERPLSEALEAMGIGTGEMQKQTEPTGGSFAQRQTALAQFLLDNFTDTERERVFAILAATFHGASVLIPGGGYAVEEIEDATNG